MKKLNNKGYMLVEIIFAFALAFALVYFIMDLVIDLKNKNDDLVIKTIIKTDQTIITNKLMNYIIEETNTPENITFSCDKIKVEGNTVKYNDIVLGIVDNIATINYDETNEDNCSNKNGKISIRIPVVVKQTPNIDYDIVIEYRYKLMYCNPLTSYSCKDNEGNTISVGNEPYVFTYDGECEVFSDGDNGDWKIKFLTSGTLKSTCDIVVDAFLVGGGGGGSGAGGSSEPGGSGGGGGYTTTSTTEIKSSKTEGYYINIGEGGKGGSAGTWGIHGTTTTAFDISAAGGSGGISRSYGGRGGDGGSGGGGASVYGYTAGSGGFDGSSGTDGGKIGDSEYGNSGGIGQGTTTREFGEPTGDLYAGGGGGGSSRGDDGDEGSLPGGNSSYWGIGSGGGGGGGSGGDEGGSGSDGTPNTGGGGGGASDGYKDVAYGGDGGSGIVVIRNTRNRNKGCSNGTLENIDFTYTGNCTIIKDEENNWRIKFLTSGTLILEDDLTIDAFLVGGGGGGGSIYGLDYHDYYAGGGGGGGYTKTFSTTLHKNTYYNILIGNGGFYASDGGSTSAFGETIKGGFGTSGVAGGSGGSGGGAGGNYKKDYIGGNGGFDGMVGESKIYDAGLGQGTTTCEFAEENCSSDKLYAGGGGGAVCGIDGTPGTGGGGGGGNGGYAGTANTGGGGGGGEGYECAGWVKFGHSGGSGIVVIRNAR